jgi:tetratricopeptide (TPR) repeat protein
MRDGSSSSLDRTVSASPRGAGPDEDFHRGTSLGRYVILDLLGSGGMGIVYAAYDPELDRRIALKLLRSAGSRTPSEQRARLLREAQAMARLNHPNVIAVHDVGMVGEQVFIAMELVEGVTLDEWLAERERAPEEIIDAFVQAGRGLVAAHAKGLVHRDFKPDNALYGADGRVRVLDFGLAYEVQTDGTPIEPSSEPPPDSSDISVDAPTIETPSPGRLASPLTRAGTLLGTPWYMSPEQLAGRRPDARSDQWSFCAALFEALYGDHPFAHPGEFDVASLERRVRDGVRRPVPPARAARVPVRVRAALDRGLMTDPATRFPTMAELVAKLERPPARSRRLGWVVATSVAVVTIIGILVFRPKPIPLCQSAARELDGVWDAPRKRAVSDAFAATGKAFSKGSFDATARALDTYADEWVAMQKEACEATRVRGVQSEELLDLRTQCLADRRAELRALGDVLSKADVAAVEHGPVAAGALSSLDACANVALLRAPTKLPVDAVKREAIVAVRARVAKARALEQAGRYADMMTEAKGATSEAGSTDFRPAVAEAEGILGRAQARAGDDKSAEATLVAAVLDAEASHDDAVAAEGWPAIVLAQANLFELDKADDAVRHGEAAVARIGGDVAHEAELEKARCILERHRSHYDDAAAHGRAALALVEARFGAADPHVVDVLQQLALGLNLQGKYDEATGYLERALRIVETTLGPDHPSTGSIYSALSCVYEYSGDAERALAYARHGLQVREQAVGPDDPSIAGHLIDLGNAEDDTGDFAASVTTYRRALTIVERTVGPEAPKAADVLFDLGTVSLERHAYADALGYAERALVIQRKLKGPTHTDVGTSTDLHASALRGLGRCKEALAEHEAALAILQAGFGADHPDVAAVLVNVARDELALHEPAKAIVAAERAVALLAKIEESDRGRADGAFVLAMALWDGAGDRGRARELAREARRLFAGSGKPADESVANVDAWLRAHGG